MFDCILHIKYNNVQTLLLLVALYKNLEDSYQHNTYFSMFKPMNYLHQFLLSEFFL